MADRVISTPLINVDSKKGKKYVRKVQKLRDEVFNLEGKQIGENTRLYKKLSEEQISLNPFLSTFLNWTKNTNDKELIKMLDCLKLVSVSIGSFGRKGGYVHYPIKEPYFRFVVHLGSPEVYYIDSYNYRKPVAMLNGYGFFISPQNAEHTSFTIFNEPIRLISDPSVQELVPKIRSKDYCRTILIYDYDYIPTDDVENEEVVAETILTSENRDEVPKLENVENSESGNMETPQTEIKVEEFDASNITPEQREAACTIF
jgi:hypothetical protein